MGIHEYTTSTPTHPDLTRSQLAALQTHGSKSTRIALLSTSQPALTNPLITCLICIHPYHSANVEGNIESPVITACGHIFGDKCITQWLEEENSGSGSGKTCPMYPPPPPTITASQIPLRCGRCEIRRVLRVEKARYDDLFFALVDNKTTLLQQRNSLREEGAEMVDGEMKLLTQRQMEETRLQTWTAFRQVEEELEVVDRRLSEIEERRKGLEGRKMEEIRARGGWFL
ncbi:hypothetical protein N431DRAFT_557767 [Stipitochalara longipes BDJ]|nr:hypothetical protein N431DRAFT_557767 [Stipitochalara longipes BDJ]